MVEYEVLETLGFSRQIVRITSGADAGAELVVVADAPKLVGRLEDFLGDEAVPLGGRVMPQVAAEHLLQSLLNKEQLSEWTNTRTLWVPTEFGGVQLGRLFDLKFRPWRGPTLSLCVVPKGFDSLPNSDIWANLLLALRGDPEWFFKVANWRRPRGQWTFGPVPESFLVRRERVSGVPKAAVAPKEVPAASAHVQLTLF